MVKNIAVVSLSRGTIGEDFAKHELEIGTKRLQDFGLQVRFMPHALKGIEYVKDHPEERASDLLQAFRDPDIDMILIPCLFVKSIPFSRLWRIGPAESFFLRQVRKSQSLRGTEKCSGY